MNPITIIFEVDCEPRPGEPLVLWKPFFFKGKFRDGYFYRVGWLCFAVALVRMSLHDYNKHIGSGATEWRRS